MTLNLGKTAEWGLIAVSGCITLYGAWLYFQPGRSLPPLRFAAECRYVSYTEFEHQENDEKFIVVCPSGETSARFDTNPLCVANISLVSPFLEKSWRSATCTGACFLAMEDSLQCPFVTTDSFSMDGLCSLFVFTNPKIAFTNRALLESISQSSSVDIQAARIRRVFEKLSKESTGFLPRSFWSLPPSERVYQLYETFLAILHDLVAYPSLINTEYYQQYWE